MLTCGVIGTIGYLQYTYDFTFPNPRIEAARVLATPPIAMPIPPKQPTTISILEPETSSAPLPPPNPSNSADPHIRAALLISLVQQSVLMGNSTAKEHARQLYDAVRGSPLEAEAVALAHVIPEHDIPTPFSLLAETQYKFSLGPLVEEPTEPVTDPTPTTWWQRWVGTLVTIRKIEPSPTVPDGYIIEDPWKNAMQDVMETMRLNRWNDAATLLNESPLLEDIRLIGIRNNLAVYTAMQTHLTNLSTAAMALTMEDQPHE